MLFCKCAAAQLLLLDCSELFKDFARDNCSSSLGILHRLVLQVLWCLMLCLCLWSKPMPAVFLVQEQGLKPCSETCCPLQLWGMLSRRKSSCTSALQCPELIAPPKPARLFAVAVTCAPAADSAAILLYVEQTGPSSCPLSTLKDTCCAVY